MFTDYIDYGAKVKALLDNSNTSEEAKTKIRAAINEADQQVKNLPNHRIPREIHARTDGMIFPSYEDLTPDTLRDFIGDVKPAFILMQIQRMVEIINQPVLWREYFEPATRREIIAEGNLGKLMGATVYVDHLSESFLSKNFLAVYPEV